MGNDRSTSRSAASALISVLLPVFLLTATLIVVDASGQDRPEKQPEFSEGLRAYKKVDWEKVVDRMLAALAAWPEDGELSRVYGRWFEPYIPHYYLGVALHELGCYQASLTQLNESILGQQEIKGATKQLEELESLKLKADRLVRQGITESEGANCRRWAAQQFIDGIKALDYRDWEKAAQSMLQAQQFEEEDGEKINIRGMRFELYLPYFYRGVAFHGLGNCKQALTEWQKSETTGAIKMERASREYARLKELRAECERLQ